MPSGGFDIEAMAIQEHGSNFKALHKDMDNAYSWKVELKNGAMVGIDFAAWAKKEHGPNAKVTCVKDKAMSWNWIVSDITVGNVRTDLVPLIEIHGGGEGSITKKLKWKSGYSTQVGLDVDVHAKVMNEASVDLKTVTSKASAEYGVAVHAHTSFNFESEQVMEDEITVSMAKPNYIYVVNVSFTANGNDYQIGGRSYIQSPVPLDT